MATERPKGSLRVVRPGERTPRRPPERDRPFLKFKSVVPAAPGWSAWFLGEFITREGLGAVSVAAFGHVEHPAGDELVPLVTLAVYAPTFRDPRPMHDFVCITDPAVGKGARKEAEAQLEFVESWRIWRSFGGRNRCGCHSYAHWLCAWIEGGYVPTDTNCRCYCHSASLLGDTTELVAPPNAWFFKPPDE